MKRTLLAGVAAFGLITGAQAFEPGAVECIAPASPGGGWDFTCRVPAAQVMPELGLVDGAIKVTNLSGAGGGIAYAHVVSERAGDENLIVAASVATATRLAQNQFAGFTANDVRWLGALGADYGVLAVGKDSPLQDLDDLVAALKDDPGAVTIVGGSAAGGFDHIKPLLVAKEGGISGLRNIRYISFESGGQALIEIKSGRADVFTGDTSEVLGDLDSGDVRLLAAFSPEPVDRLGDTPTAKAQGYDVVAGNWRGFYAPSGISDEAYNYWVDAVRQVGESAQWAALRKENGLADFASYGDDFEQYVRSQIDGMVEISKELGIIQ